MMKSLAQELQAERLLNVGDTVVVGVSGGPDSMALLHLLLGLSREQNWNLDLHVAHLNHQLRGSESEKDAAFVLAAADSLDLPCIVETCDVAKLAEQESIGVEELGRRERFAFFERACGQVGSRIVAVAHHADDQAETILHRILRGTGLRGLAGMRPSRPLRSACDIRVIRPLLRKSKQELRDYLADTGIAFREDRTNNQNEPMRNRLRNIVFPLLEQEVNPQVRDALTRLAEQAYWLQAYLSETVEKTFDTLILSRTDQSLVMNADAMIRKSRIVQAELVRMAYRSFGLGEQDLSFHHLVTILDLASETESGKQSQLPGGMTVEKRYHQLIFSVVSTEARETLAPEVSVRLPGVTVLPVRGIELICSIIDLDPDDLSKLRHRKSTSEEFLDFDAVRPPLTLRGRRSGDRFFPLGAPGSKKLSDFLIDSKVSPIDRDRIAILCDQLGPIWIVGHRIDDRVKLTALSRRAVHVSATPLND